MLTRILANTTHTIYQNPLNHPRLPLYAPEILKYIAFAEQMAQTLRDFIPQGKTIPPVSIEHLLANPLSRKPEVYALSSEFFYLRRRIMRGGLSSSQKKDITTQLISLNTLWSALSLSAVKYLGITEHELNTFILLMQKYPFANIEYNKPIFSHHRTIKEIDAIITQSSGTTLIEDKKTFREKHFYDIFAPHNYKNKETRIKPSYIDILSDQRIKQYHGLTNTTTLEIWFTNTEFKLSKELVGNTIYLLNTNESVQYSVHEFYEATKRIIGTAGYKEALFRSKLSTITFQRTDGDEAFLRFVYDVPLLKQYLERTPLLSITHKHLQP